MIIYCILNSETILYQLLYKCHQLRELKFLYYLIIKIRQSPNFYSRGNLMMICIHIILSFPPFFGLGLSLFLSGFIFQFLSAFVTAYIGSALGSCLCFYTSRWLLQGRRCPLNEIELLKREFKVFETIKILKSFIKIVVSGIEVPAFTCKHYECPIWNIKN